MIYEPSVIGNSGTSRLVWHLRVTSETSPVDEVVLVDARTGEVAFHFSQIMDAKYRDIYDCANVPGSTGYLARSEGDAVTGIADVDYAYDYLGDTYDFYSSHLAGKHRRQRAAPSRANLLLSEQRLPIQQCVLDWL
jgi:Zn-dependent metalloprotease